MNPSAALIMTAAALIGPAQRRDSVTDSARDSIRTSVQGTLIVIDNILVPAGDPGRIVKIEKLENDWTAPNEVVAWLEDEQVKLREQASRLRVEAAGKAIETAEFELNAAIEAAAVARIEYSESQEILKVNEYAIPRTQLRREELTARRAKLQADAAGSRLSQASSEMEVSKAELAEAAHLVVRRQVVCPIKGKVVEVLKKPGEWVQAGEPVFRVVRMDRLRVEFYLQIKEMRPDQAEGAAVDVHFAELGLTLPSQITFVSPELEADQTYRVWAEIENPPSTLRENAYQLAHRRVRSSVLSVESLTPLAFASPSSLSPLRSPIRPMPTLAESLVNSAARPVSLRVRPDLTMRRHRYHGQAFWVVKEPIGLNYYRFHEEEFAILQMLDGHTSLQTIKERFESEFAPQKITFQDLQQFVGMLHRSGLVISEATGQGWQLKKRRDEKSWKELMGKMSNVFALRFRGIDPERILNVVHRYTWWLFTPAAVIFFVLFGLSALTLLLVQFDVFRTRLPAFHEFFGPANWMYLGVTMAVVKVLHEFGHGLSCKHFGGECHEMGVDAAGVHSLLCTATSPIPGCFPTNGIACSSAPPGCTWS